MAMISGGNGIVGFGRGGWPFLALTLALTLAALLPAPPSHQPIVPQPHPTIPPLTPQPGAAAPNQGVLSLTARYGKDLPAINGGLVWRVFADKPDDTGTFKLIREERGATPNIVLP